VVPKIGLQKLYMKTTSAKSETPGLLGKSPKT